ncbi:hypothetical protein PHLGIDRAFT_117046, partial [Phlebiopsis gigantea 11061_1 CR5-6]
MSDFASASGASGGSPHTHDSDTLPVPEDIWLDESESISTSLSPHSQSPDSSRWGISDYSDDSLEDVDDSPISQGAGPSQEAERSQEADEFILRVCDSNFFRSRRATTPVHSNLASTHSELLATPRGGRGATTAKDPDYAYHVLLEMDRKYTEMDTEEFLDKFVDAPRMTKAQLKKAGDFSYSCAYAGVTFL